MVVVTIIGILATFAVPGFSNVVERIRVREALATLQMIWAAERVYFVENNEYQIVDTADVNAGTDVQWTKLGLPNPNAATNRSFDYSVPDTDPPGTFEAHAVRSGTAMFLKINEDGQVESGDAASDPLFDLI